MTRQINPDVRREAELYTDGPVEDRHLFLAASRLGLPLYVTAPELRAVPKPASYDADALRTMIRSEERALKECERLAQFHSARLARLRDRLSARLDFDARERAHTEAA